MKQNTELPSRNSSHKVVVALGMVAAIAAMGLFAANDFDRRAIHWGRMQVVLMFALPPLLGLALLSVRRLHAVGIAYAAGIGGVGALALVLPVGLLIVVLGVQTREQLTDTFALAGYTLAMLLVAISAWVAQFRMPRAERRSSIAALCAVAAGLYVLFGWGFFQTATRAAYDRAALIRAYNDRQAKVTITAITECARTKAAGNAQHGFPANMNDLFAAGCLPKKLQRGQSNSVAGADGYAFYYYSDPPEAGGKSARFAACARAENDGSGTRVIGVDTGGNLTELESPAWKPVASCFAAWAGNDDKRYLNALAGCAMSAAALRPGRGYAPNIFGIHGYHSGACDFKPLEIVPTGRARTERGVIEYQPEPEVGGVIRGYKLVLFPQAGGAPLEIDHLGRVQTLAIPSVAPTVDAIESARPARGLKEAGLDAKRRDLKITCESGQLSVCEDLGDFEWNNSRPDEARRWWEHACERGRLQSCLLSSRYSPNPSSSEARSNKDRCLDGDARYCEKLAELARQLTPEIEVLRRQGGRQSSSGAQGRIEEKRRELAPRCETGDAALCDQLGELEWDTQRPGEAVRWWDRACALGRFQSCLLGNQYNPLPGVRDRILGLQSRCRQGGADACQELDATVKAHRARIDALLAKNRTVGAASNTKK